MKDLPDKWHEPNVNRIRTNLSAKANSWLLENCPMDFYVESSEVMFNLEEGGSSRRGILVFARSADALAFSLTFPTFLII